jgi:hypothetical protein
VQQGAMQHWVRGVECQQQRLQSLARQWQGAQHVATGALALIVVCEVAAVATYGTAANMNAREEGQQHA